MEKKIYMAPEMDAFEMELLTALLVDSDPDADGNPVQTIDNPDDDDLEWP